MRVGTILTTLGLCSAWISVAWGDTVSLLSPKDNTLYEAVDPAGQLSNGQGIFFTPGRLARPMAFISAVG